MIDWVIGFNRSWPFIFIGWGGLGRQGSPLQLKSNQDSLSLLKLGGNGEHSVYVVISIWSILCSGIWGFEEVRTEILKTIIGTKPEYNYFGSVNSIHRIKRIFIGILVTP
jgi:hypothetical protein